MAEETAREPGPVERAVRQDIAELGELKGEFVRSMAEVAYVLAKAVDDSGADGPAAAVNWARELRMTLEKLREDARERGDGDDGGDLGTPVWDGGAAVRDAAVAGAADAGAAGGGGGAAAG